MTKQTRLLAETLLNLGQNEVVSEFSKPQMTCELREILMELNIHTGWDFFMKEKLEEP